MNFLQTTFQSNSFEEKKKKIQQALSVLWDRITDLKSQPDSVPAEKDES